MCYDHVSMELHSGAVLRGGPWRIRSRLGYTTGATSTKDSTMDAEITGPNQHDELDVKGQIHFLMTDADGTVVMDETVDNAFTANGKNALLDQFLASPTLGKPTHMALGSGTPGANALGTQLGNRNAITKSRTGNVLTMIGSFDPGEATGAVTEAGIFDASTGGNMFNSSTFAVINKTATMTLEITWTLTLT